VRFTENEVDDIRMHSKTLTIIAFAALFFWSFSVFHIVETCAATGTTLYVDDSGGANYTKIQDAIDAASPGDEIYVYSGTYVENIVVNKNLFLTGHDKETTIIDGGKNGHVIRVLGSLGHELECTISGFTIKNAGRTGNDCIAMSYGRNSGIIDNIITNSDQSSGIQLDHGDNVTIRDNTITANDQEHGIYLILSENIIIYDNLIQSNSRGIYLVSSSNNRIYDNEITGNRYGIYILSSSTNNQLYLNDFTSNDIQNAYDATETNSWSYNSQGNYWDDYNNYDTDKDGIGDTPYNIPGDSNKDLYPLGYFLNPYPVAYIDSISPNPATQGETVSFSGHGTDDGTIIEWEWKSTRDGVLSNAEDFSSSGLSVGTHTISFRVKDDDDVWSEPATTTLAINTPGSANQKPTATISVINPQQTTYGETVYFSGFGTDVDGTITGYNWSSSLDGLLSIEPSFNTSGLSVGTHFIYFRVRDNDGDWSSADIETLVISPSSSSTNHPPVAHTGGPYAGKVNASLTFNASGSYDSDGTITSYSWDFGDGNTGSGIVAEHSYTQAGTYTVTVTVTDNESSQTTNTTLVIITHASGSSNQPGTSSGSGDGILVLPFTITAALISVAIVFIAILVGFFFWMKRPY